MGHEHYVIKLVIVGDMCTQKTAIIGRYVTGEYSPPKIVFYNEISI